MIEGLKRETTTKKKGREADRGGGRAREKIQRNIVRQRERH